MLHFKNRHDKVHIITLDRILATDVYERLHEYPGMESVELVQPGNGKSAITVKDLRKLVIDTTKSSVLVIDVRRKNKQSVQRIYRDIVRLNQPDFHCYCYTVLIGDGPINLFTTEQHMELFYTYLSGLQVDYNPAVFFASPFLHNHLDDIQKMDLYDNSALPEKIPHHLERYFSRISLSVKHLFK